ncbi:hypothetical protein BKP45_11220 [Anaerobacillus alkalidiazotrophicus]|uniref:DUF2269 domain-containing protein n=1 Tax=Anaerobacillus alkalidiazotrophicus TaxID=472963 RepID=A0A1S2M760_9BACI|nr:hypothetical protein [Anaerobacillus alkalidiazotrophicus]OIJ18158.1 hypothetical protein BKP45_16935 [Anaerobacillus alkalidiazotrophicus]OIJ19637.1 hypothetical protein BKP45_11220 [Anaerobacillus alkalidiazotrophicus]
MLLLIAHQLISILFLILFPLPIIAFVKSRTKQQLPTPKLWKILVMLANLALFVSLITGFIIFPDYTSLRVWISVILVLVIGAFLGIFSKRLKLYQLEKDIEAQQKHLRKISTIGFGYIIITIGTFWFMSNWHNF